MLYLAVSLYNEGANSRSKIRGRSSHCAVNTTMAASTYTQGGTSRASVREGGIIGMAPPCGWEVTCAQMIEALAAEAGTEPQSWPLQEIRTEGSLNAHPWILDLQHLSIHGSMSNESR